MIEVTSSEVHIVPTYLYIHGRVCSRRVLLPKEGHLTDTDEIGPIMGKACLDLTVAMAGGDVEEHHRV